MFHIISLLAKKLQTCLSCPVLFSNFHISVEAWQLQLHRHFPDRAFLHIKQQLTNSQWPSAYARSAQKTERGEIRDWQLSSLETFNDVFSVYSFTVLTWAINICRTCLADESWVSGNWFKRSIHFQDSWIIFKIHFHKLLKEK